MSGLKQETNGLAHQLRIALAASTESKSAASKAIAGELHATLEAESPSMMSSTIALQLLKLPLLTEMQKSVLYSRKIISCAASFVIAKHNWRQLGRQQRYPRKLLQQPIANSRRH